MGLSDPLVFSLAAGRDDGSSELDATGRGGGRRRRGGGRGGLPGACVQYISDKKEAVPTS